MPLLQTRLTIQTKGRGLELITREVEAALHSAAGATDSFSGPGLLHCFLQHTSASLLVQENADPSAKHDLEEFLERLIPEGEAWYRHLDEGPDDTVSHMRAAVTDTSLTIPMNAGRLQLGTWQGLYLWEHRARPHRRTLVLTLIV